MRRREFLKQIAGICGAAAIPWHVMPWPSEEEVPEWVSEEERQKSIAAVSKIFKEVYASKLEELMPKGLFISQIGKKGGLMTFDEWEESAACMITRETSAYEAAQIAWDASWENAMAEAIQAIKDLGVKED